MALERATGRTAWRYESPAAAKGAFGFPGSPALGDGLVASPPFDTARQWSV